MRTTSAAVSMGHYRAASQLKPRDGTLIREVYDKLTDNKGFPVKLLSDHRTWNARQQLMNFYGLDIRRVCKGTFMLVGEWFGDTYVDYVADRINKEGREQ